jgi:hypothetical protein
MIYFHINICTSTILYYTFQGTIFDLLANKIFEHFIRSEGYTFRRYTFGIFIRSDVIR